MRPAHTPMSLKTAATTRIEDEAVDPEKHSSNELAEDRTRLAAVRTRMAADRTLMGWVRTGMSMITFGFTLYKVLQSLQDDGMALRTDQTPRNLGLFLVAVGTLSMIF